MLIQHGCEVTTVPVFTKSDEVLSIYPDSIFLSNGPRDPAGMSHALNNVKQLIDKKLIFGICLWRQILCLTIGAKSFKFRFGYRGSNRPVIDLKSKKVEITSKNH